MSARRLFFALWPSEAEQCSLAEAARDLVTSSGARAMVPANLHVTLVFLGSVGEDALPQVRSVALNVSERVRVADRPISLTFDRLEHWRKPQIVCATASSSPRAASELADDLKHTLVAAGFTPDVKAFRAHVTLVRKMRNVDASLSVRALSIILEFRDFSLVESRTEVTSSTYSVIESWPLCAC